MSENVSVYLCSFFPLFLSNTFIVQNLPHNATSHEQPSGRSTFWPESVDAQRKKDFSTVSCSGRRRNFWRDWAPGRRQLFVACVSSSIVLFTNGELYCVIMRLFDYAGEEGKDVVDRGNRKAQIVAVIQTFMMLTNHTSDT